MDPLEARLLKLERENRWLKAVGLVGLFGLLGGVGAWSRTGPAREVRTERLVVTDDQGKPRAELGSDGLVLHDGAGAPRALLALLPDGSPRLSFASAAGPALAELTAFGNAAPRLVLSSPEGREFFEVALHVDGSSRLSLSDNRGPRIAAAVNSAGAPSLELNDPSTRGAIDLSLDGPRPSLLLEDASGDVFRAPPGGDPRSSPSDYQVPE